MWGVRFGALILYAPLRWLPGFPPTRHGDSVKVSRHKFSGLIGHTARLTVEGKPAEE